LRDFFIEHILHVCTIPIYRVYRLYDQVYRLQADTNIAAYVFAA